MAGARFFGSTKKYSEDPEVIERPVGTSVLYVLLSLSIVGCVVGLFPTGESCKMSEPPICASARHSYVVSIISGSIAVLVIAALLWNRRAGSQQSR